MIDMNRRHFVGVCAAGALSAVAHAPSRAIAGPPPGRPRTVAFADGTRVPALGQGSWHMADGQTPQAVEDAMRLGISLGLTLIDTSDDYGEGRAETMIARVIAGQRDKVFLVSKLAPYEATEEGVERALRASLARLGTDHLDLYLLHWREPPSTMAPNPLLFPKDADLRGAVKGFEKVRRQGLTRRWGVSNFMVEDMNELVAVAGGEHCATNQVLYNLAARGIEADLLPWCAKHGMPVMAYSPLGAGGHGALLSNPTLKKLGAARGISPAAIALAWAMRDGRTIAVTETASAQHIRENAEAATLRLSETEIKTLDDAFPPPRAG